MPTPPLSDELAQQAVDALREAGGVKQLAADALGIRASTLTHRLKKAAERGMLGTEPVLPGFRISKSTAIKDEDGKTVREFIQQRPETGGTFEIPDGLKLKGVTALVDGNGQVLHQHIMARAGAFDPAEALRIAIDECRKDIPRTDPVAPPTETLDLLLNQYTVTDLHFGMLAWAEETGDADYDLGIAEKLLIDWFTAAIATSPAADTAILAQLGDLMHHDALESVTPASRNVLDADSRLQKMIRVVVRVVRLVIRMLLEKHQHVRVIMASANHDPASSAWMRELLAVLYEEEPRVSVDNSADIYYSFEWGNTALFYHHGHKRNIGGAKSVDQVFAGKFREMFGRCEHSYGHVGHLHSDEVQETNLMRLERHRTLAPKDAYASSGGWLSKRDAKVITYHKQFGEVSRNTLSPQMVMKR